MPTNHHQLLSDHHIRPTKHRLNILDALLALDKPATVDQLLNWLHTHHYHPDQVTVYRTLEVLNANDLIHQVDFADGRSRYELNSSHHHHLVCQHCGQIEPVFDCVSKSLLTKIKADSGFTITSHNLEFFGLCKHCQQEAHETN